MPIEGARYRFKRVGPGKWVRLAFRGKGKVVETTTYHGEKGSLKKGRVVQKGEAKTKMGS